MAYGHALLNTGRVAAARARSGNPVNPLSSCRWLEGEARKQNGPAQTDERLSGADECDELCDELGRHDFRKLPNGDSLAAGD